MRFSEKGKSVADGENQLFGMNLHDFIQKEESTHAVELASEFGLTLGEVRKLKKQLGRS